MFRVDLEREQCFGGLSHMHQTHQKEWEPRIVLGVITKQEQAVGAAREVHW